jgi:type IV secretion system protein TrbL
VSGLLGSLAGCVADPLNCSSLVGSATGSVISAGANTIIGAWAADFQKAEATMLSTLMGSWLKLSTPNVSDSSTSAVAFLTQNTAYLVGICGIVGLLIAAARMMWYQRAEPAREALAGLLRLVVVQGCAVSAIGLLSAAGDSLATSIMNNATAMAGTGAQSLGQISMSAIGSATLVIVLSGLAIIAFFVQLVLLIVRDGLLVLMAGTLPLSAAASMTPVGNSWFRKNVGWLLAFLLFKPIAALVYGAAILSVTNSTDITGEITGIVLVALATLTLPALMRMVAPMVSAIGNISAASAAGMVAGVATGAVAIVATGGAAAPMVAGGLGRQAGNLGSQALGSSNGGAGNLASGSAPPAAGAATPGASPPQSAPASSGASVGTTNGSKANG